jgi:hypothetical protein
MDGPADLMSGRGGSGGSRWKSMDQSVGSRRMLSPGEGKGSRASSTRITELTTNIRARAARMSRRRGKSTCHRRRRDKARRFSW